MGGGGGGGEGGGDGGGGGGGCRAGGDAAGEGGVVVDVEFKEVEEGVREGGDCAVYVWMEWRRVRFVDNKGRGGLWWRVVGGGKEVGDGMGWDGMKKERRLKR